MHLENENCTNKNAARNNQYFHKPLLFILVTKTNLNNQFLRAYDNNTQ